MEPVARALRESSGVNNQALAGFMVSHVCERVVVSDSTNPTLTHGAETPTFGELRLITCRTATA
jgi:hypothetical protein